MDQNIFGTKEYFRKIFTKRFPFATLGLIILLPACFGLESVMKAPQHPGFLLACFGISRESLSNGHILRLVTANFFHMNEGHLISNVFGLVIFMGILEYLAGFLRSVLILMVSALGGTIGSIIIHFVTGMVGASTILFGVFGSLGAFIFIYRKDLGRWFVPASVIWLIYFAAMSMAGYISLKIVDHGAHIGGFIAGTSAMFFLTNGKSLEDLTKPAGSGIKISLIVLALIFIAGFIKEVFIYTPLVFKQVNF